MPSIKTSTKAGQDAIAAGTLVRTPPVNVAPPAPDLTTTNKLNPFLFTPLPASFGQQPDSQRQFQLGGVIGQDRVPPLPAAASATVGSQTQSQSDAFTVLVNSTHVPLGSQVVTNATNISTNTTAIANLQATSFQGAWSSTTTYSQGASVDYSGSIYVSLVNSNLNHVPSSSPTDWQATGGTGSYAGVWNSGTSYTTGQTVSVSSTLYIALQNSTNENPATTTGYWQILSNASYYYGTWSSSTAYPAGAEVGYNGTVWIALSANTNQTPGIGSSYWTAVGNSTILISAYSGATTYSAGMQVIGTDGNVYQAIQTTTGNAPPNATYWQLVGPSSLTSVPDGTQRFAATASVLSYVPTSNPLSATDAGSSATVSIASFTLQTSSKGSVSYNSGAITGLNYSTQYYVVLSDPSLSGGTVTYSAYTSKSSALAAGAGYFFIGSIVTPAATAPNTVGNNDGGVGSQSGQTSIFLFGTSTPTVTGGATDANSGNAIDGDLTTFAKINIVSTAATQTASLAVKAASPTSAPWSSLTLYIRSAVPSNTVSTGSTTVAQMQVNVNGSLTTVYTLGYNTTRAVTVDSVSLPVNTNLALITVTGSLSKTDATSTKVAEMDIYEAWVEGVIG
jgi:hypothetical protein